MPRLLIISSQVHEILSLKQLAYCEELVKKSSYDYHIETSTAGAYEIPFIINAYQQKKPFDAYLALGLVLKTDLDHYHYIRSHINDCFTAFALNHIAVGNGIIYGDSTQELAEKLASQNPCHSAYPAAFNAVDYLIKLNKNLSS